MVSISTRGEKRVDPLRSILPSDFRPTERLPLAARLYALPVILGKRAETSIYKSVLIVSIFLRLAICMEEKIIFKLQFIRVIIKYIIKKEQIMSQKFIYLFHFNKLEIKVKFLTSSYF